MNYKTVTLEIPTFVTLANIEAESGAMAVFYATELIDYKSLIDRNPRGYSENLSKGSILEIKTKDMPVAGAVKTTYEAEDVSCTYRITPNGEIIPAVIDCKNKLFDAINEISNLLNDAIENGNINKDDEYINAIQNVINTSGVLFTQNTVEDVLNGNATPSTPNAYFFEVNEEENEKNLLDKIRERIGKNPTKPTFLMQSAIFVNKANDDENETQPSPGWAVQFGEVEIIYDGKKIAAIGTWREFTSPGIIYFDDQEEIEIARRALLELNNINTFFIDRPNLPDRISAEIDL